MTAKAVSRARRPANVESGIDLKAMVMQPNGSPCLETLADGGARAMTAGTYIYMLLNRQGMDTSDIKKVVRINVLAREVYANREGRMLFTAEEIGMIRDQLPGQPAPFIFGLLSIIDPAMIEKAG